MIKETDLVRPLVSVVMPVYNSAKFLKEAIESVLAETYTNFEFLIYDDASSDDSLSIIQCFSKKDGRIRILKGKKKQENVSIIYKFLVNESKGEYFIPTDSDDICLPFRIETLINAAIKHGLASLFFGKTRIINEDGTKTIGFYGNEASPYKLFLRNFVPDGASLISRYHYIACGGYNDNTEWAEDYELRLRLIEQGPFIYIDKEVYLYRRHNDSLTSKKRNIKREEVFKKAIAKKSINIVRNTLIKRMKWPSARNRYKYNYQEYVAIKFSAAFYLSKYNLLKAYKLFSLLSCSNLPWISLLWLLYDKAYTSPKTRETSHLKAGLLPLVSRNLIRVLFKSALYKIDYKTENHAIIDKTIVTKEIVINKLQDLGLKRGQKIIVHSALSSFGFVVGGPETIINTLKEIIGKDGLIIMPAFTYYTESGFLKKYFEIDSVTSKDIGIIAEKFRKSSEVYRNFHPFTSFSFWGLNAREYSQKYLMADSFTLNSPLGEILKGGGHVLMLGTDFSTLTILHTAEYMADVPYSTYKSTFNYIDSGIKKSVELRRTGHSGEFNKIAPFFNINDKVKIGNAQCCLIDAQQIIQKAKEILIKEPDFFLCRDRRCKTCIDRRKMCI